MIIIVKYVVNPLTLYSSDLNGCIDKVYKVYMNISMRYVVYGMLIVLPSGSYDRKGLEGAHGSKPGLYFSDLNRCIRCKEDTL